MLSEQARSDHCPEPRRVVVCSMEVDGTAAEQRRRMIANSRLLIAEGKRSVAYSAKLLERSTTILAQAGRAKGRDGDWSRGGTTAG